MNELAIVGLGSWGLSVLERTVSWAQRSSRPVRVHLIQPGSVGGGVYGMDQPDYLVLNNPCGQLSLYAAPDEGVEPPYARGLFEWATDKGYRWVDWECRIDPAGTPLQPTDFLPRRLMGEYLAEFHAGLVAAAPANLEIVHHDAAAVDIVAAGGRERVLLAGGGVVEADHVVLTSGHTWNEEEPPGLGSVRYARPYPVGHFDRAVAAGAPIAIAGLGLVAFDLLISLTVGRGGTFVGRGLDRRYVPSGREPAISLYSRSGVPYCAKSSHGTDPTGAYEPVVATPAVFKSFAERRRSGRGPGVDFRGEVLPLILSEMRCRYHYHAAFRAGGTPAALDVAGTLADSWAAGTFDECVSEMERTHGRFDPTEHLFPGRARHRSGLTYQADVQRMVADDLREALMEGGSPVKAAQEVTRILRDELRSVIEFGGLTHESYVDFQQSIRGRINRLEAGPPALRSEQLLALMDAGVVRVPFGPDPQVAANPDGSVTIRSTRLEREHAATVSSVLRGHLDMPSLARSASPLIRRLYTTGRLSQLSYAGQAVGSVALSEDFHPLGADGEPQERLSVLGVLTEGVRYFTHYLPSPQSRLRAVLDAQACVAAALGGP